MHYHKVFDNIVFLKRNFFNRIVSCFVLILGLNVSFSKYVRSIPKFPVIKNGGQNFEHVKKRFGQILMSFELTIRYAFSGIPKLNSCFSGTDSPRFTWYRLLQRLTNSGMAQIFKKQGNVKCLENIIWIQKVYKRPTNINGDIEST